VNNIEKAEVTDAAEILSLQKLAYISEAEIYHNYDIQPLKETVEEVQEAFKNHVFLKYVENGKILGSVKALEKDGTCYIGKLMVHPDCQNRGIGKQLMSEIERQFPHARFELFTGGNSTRNISFYEKLGYKGFKREKSPVEDTVFLFMEKRR
jgi:ribosomal protein S18 acetylase RimI-like enzyme